MFAKHDEVGAHIVKALQDNMLENEVIMDLLTDVRHKASTVFEIDMYEPVVRRICFFFFKYSRIE